MRHPARLAPQKRPFHKLTPKNLRYFVVLLAGGPADRFREIREALRFRGMMVRHHWNFEHQKQWNRSIPADVDFAIGLKEMMGGPLAYKLKRHAEQAGTPFVVTTHKIVGMLGALRQRFGISAAEGEPLPLPRGVPELGVIQEQKQEPTVAPSAGPTVERAHLRPTAPEPGPESSSLLRQLMEKRNAELEPPPEPTEEAVAEEHAGPPLAAAPEPQPATAPIPLGLTVLVPPAPPGATSDEVAALREARLKRAGEDTMALIYELQARLSVSIYTSITIELERVIFSAGGVKR